MKKYHLLLIFFLAAYVVNCQNIIFSGYPSYQSTVTLKDSAGRSIADIDLQEYNPYAKLPFKNKIIKSDGDIDYKVNYKEYSKIFPAKNRKDYTDTIYYESLDTVLLHNTLMYISQNGYLAIVYQLTAQVPGSPEAILDAQSTVVIFDSQRKIIYNSIMPYIDNVFALSHDGSHLVMRTGLSYPDGILIELSFKIISIPTNKVIYQAEGRLDNIVNNLKLKLIYTMLDRENDVLMIFLTLKMICYTLMIMVMKTNWLH